MPFLNQEVALGRNASDVRLVLGEFQISFGLHLKAGEGVRPAQVDLAV
jgi:hypothetical protein